MGGPEDASSPQLHLRLESPAATHSQGEALLSEVAEHAQQHGGTLLAVHRLALNDRCAKQVTSRVVAALDALLEHADHSRCTKYQCISAPVLCCNPI